MIKTCTPCKTVIDAKAELLLKRAEISILSDEISELRHRQDLLSKYATKLEEKVDQMEKTDSLNNELHFLRGQMNRG